MKYLKIGIIFSVLTLPVGASAQNERPYPYQYSSMGGLESCPQFGGAPENEAWVSGYFSGRNREAGASVGMSFTATQIVDRIKALCGISPSLDLLMAAERVYEQMRKEPRPNIQ